MPLPGRKADQVVGPHQPAEPVLRAAAAKRLHRLPGERRPEPGFGRDHPDFPACGCQMPRPVEPGAKRRHAVALFQRILRADKPPDLVEAKLPRGAVGQVKMAFMRRVEGPAEQADPKPPPVMEQVRRQVAARLAGISHRGPGHCP